MFQKLFLIHSINRFYKTFGYELEMPNSRVTLRDLNNRDCLLETQFHIHEMLEAHNNYFNETSYAIYGRLNKLYNKINNILF